MKKALCVILVLTIIILSLGGCGLNNKNTQPTSSEASDKQSTDKGVPETRVVRWTSGTSGNVLLTIADKMGYFKDAGLKIKEIPATSNTDAMTLLSTGKVDIASNSGTSNPLQQIASGVDLTIFGGHMVTGCMPIIARKGTKWNGPQDLINKKFACNPSYFALTGAVMDLGYEDPLDAVDWISYTNYDDALAAVVRGEADYALMGTEKNYSVENMNDVDIMCYQSDIMPKYSCCRMEATTKFVKDNPITVKHLLKALLRAQSYYESHKNEAVNLHAKRIKTDKDYVAAYMLNKHYVVHVDPLRNSVIRAWNILDKTGFLDKNAKNIDIRDHINTKLYEDAMNEAISEYGDKDPEFYKRVKTFYKENDL